MRNEMRNKTTYTIDPDNFLMKTIKIVLKRTSN